jgi:nucleoside-diphosphate-sugar epimerase
VILGGTGALGGAAAARLADSGWTVDVTGRDPLSMPHSLTEMGVRIHAIDRGDTDAIAHLVGSGVDLLVDLLAFRAADVRAILPLMASATSSVVISGRAVYVDARGNHLNSDHPPRFPVPIREDNPTLPPANEDMDPFSREGYAPCKVAVERTALDSGLPVTVIRPSKVHGRWARNARTRQFVEAMDRGETPIELAENGRSVDHLTAASNTAALIEVVSALPDARILNSADPDTPTAAEIVRSIGVHLGWNGTITGADATNDPDQGHHPWRTAHPVVLDTTAAARLGYLPVGTSLDLLVEEIDWVRHTPSR